MTQTKYDVVVIGAGPGGYVAAIRCAQLGMSTLCIDKYLDEDGKAAPGGTCLNVGCIPSKALLDSSKHYEHLGSHLEAHGISVKGASIDVKTMIERKQKIVKQLTGGITQLFKANKVDYISGEATLQNDQSVSIKQNADGKEIKVNGKHIILASGSVPFEIPSVPFDGKLIVDNVGALEFDKTPKKLGVIGAGVIGLELGTVWRRLGSEVIVLEAMDEFLGAADKEISKLAAREFKKQGLDIRLGARVEKASTTKTKVKVTYTWKGESKEESFDRLLVAVGRKAYTGNLLADDSGIKLTDRGQIEINALNQTSIKNVWAVGDAVEGPMLAHKASEEGIAVAERIAGGHMKLDHNTIPWIIYTQPEIAWVGKTEQQLKEAGVEYKAGSFPFAANGRALASGEGAGMVKILADAKTDRILGVHIAGMNASELIAESVLAMECQCTSEDLALTVHAHPTLSESVHEAALAVHNKAIHKVNRK
ncbi:MAG: dihydrolipoyl dehydrogenase [bacterium]